MQTSILPRKFAVPGLEISAKMIPASEVGGDYYDVIPVDDGCWIAIGDVSGHGLDAGLVMLMLQSSITPPACSPGRKPRPRRSCDWSTSRSSTTSAPASARATT